MEIAVTWSLLCLLLNIGLSNIQTTILLLLSGSRAQDYGYEEPECDIVVFNGIYFDRQMLFGGYGRAFNLFMHELSGDLYFSRASRKEDLMDRQIMTCNNRKNYCTTVRGLDRGYAIAYDRNTDTIYFGAPDGVYRYDFFLKKAKLVALEEVAIFDIHVYDNYFYYIVSKTRRLYATENYNFTDVALVFYTEVDHFHVSRTKHFYFSNRTGLYRYSNKHHRVITNNKTIEIRQIAQDANNNVYFGTNLGIYMYKDSSKFIKIMKMSPKSELFGMTVINLLSPKFNLVVMYSDENYIYRLIGSENVECIKQFEASLKDRLEKWQQKRNKTLSPSVRVAL